MSGPGPFAGAWHSLNNDLNTAEALGHLFVTLKSLKADTLTPEDAAVAWHGLHFILHAFGFILPDPEAQAEDIPDDIRAVAEKRWAARTAKNWADADALRKELDALGWVMKDGKENYELSRK
ncbi:MAG TPA: DALR domain-containing protein, partial [Verrucomicrobiales bacterium]|nr:DALR domain-containing protein [Verrucomicrobiales bacterium]